MTSLTFAFSGTEPILSADFFPPVELESSYAYEVGLLSFESYNSIPNVDESNNKFHYGGKGKFIAIPEGTYEVAAIATYLKEQFAKVEPNYFLKLDTNNNTLQTTIKANFPIDLTPKDSIGRLLGFEAVKVEPNRSLSSVGVVDIFRVNSVQVECNIATGSFINGEPAHTLYQFFPAVAAGFKLVEEPSPVIYLPTTSRTISNITLRVTDQAGRLINFRGERITLRLHLRRVTY